MIFGIVYSAPPFILTTPQMILKIRKYPLLMSAFKPTFSFPLPLPLLIVLHLLSSAPLQSSSLVF